MSKHLHAIGTPMRSICKSPGYPTGPLPGSRGLPTKTARTEPDPNRVPPVTVGRSYTHDDRVQVGEGEAVPEFFGAYFPGIDPMTGRAWADRGEGSA